MSTLRQYRFQLIIANQITETRNKIYTSLHFTSLHFTSHHFTTLSSRHFASFPFTSLHFTALHTTSHHFTTLPSRHFASFHFHVTSLHGTSHQFTSLHYTCFTSLRVISLHVISLQVTSRHFTSLHVTSLHFLHVTSRHFTSRHFTLSHFTSLHVAKPILQVGVEDFAKIFPSLTVSSRSSYSVPFDSSFLKNLLYPFFPSLSDSRIFSVNVNPRCVWQTNSLFTVNIYNTKQLVTCFNVIPFRWGLYCTRRIGMLSPVPLQPVGTLER